MADINWIAVADRLHSEGHSLRKVDQTASIVLSFLSYALRDGVDAAERFEIDKSAHSAADRYAQEACDARKVLLPGWREEFMKQFIEGRQS